MKEVVKRTHIDTGVVHQFLLPAKETINAINR